MVSFNGEEHECLNSKPKFGELVFFSSPIPHDCEADVKFLDGGDVVNFFHAVVITEHGMIPGRSSEDLSEAKYGFDGQEYTVNDNFYIVC